MGDCVAAHIVVIYRRLNKKMSRDKVVKDCDTIANSGCLDGDDGDNWSRKDGVRTSTLNRFLLSHNISFYAFDINNKCFQKFISKK